MRNCYMTELLLIRRKAPFNHPPSTERNCYMAEILPIRRKAPFNKSITQSINQFIKLSTNQSYSAGVGRTGVFIALDAMYQEGKKTGKVNVAEFVNRMRHNRVSMVQTYVRFALVHES